MGVSKIQIANKWRWTCIIRMCGFDADKHPCLFVCFLHATLDLRAEQKQCGICLCKSIPSPGYRMGCFSRFAINFEPLQICRSIWGEEGVCNGKFFHQGQAESVFGSVGKGTGDGLRIFSRLLTKWRNRICSMFCSIWGGEVMEQEIFPESDQD